MAAVAELEARRIACRAELDKMPEFVVEGNQLRFGSAFVALNKTTDHEQGNDKLIGCLSLMSWKRRPSFGGILSGENLARRICEL